MKIFPAFFVFSLSILTLTIGQAQTTTNDWHQWRGPENNGVSSTATPPLEWSEKKNLSLGYLKTEISLLQVLGHHLSRCV